MGDAASACGPQAIAALRVQPGDELHVVQIFEQFEPQPQQVGAHSRSAVGMAELPFDIPVEIEGEVEIRS